MGVWVEESCTSAVEGCRDLPSRHQEKHPPWGSMMVGVGMKQNQGHAHSGGQKPTRHLPRGKLRPRRDVLDTELLYARYKQTSYYAISSVVRRVDNGHGLPGSSLAAAVMYLSRSNI